jgi:hypothetical protein
MSERRSSSASTFVLAFVIGGIAGALLDQIHVRMGVLWYPRPVLLGQAWWVVPLFGAATLATLGGLSGFVARSPSLRQYDLLDGGLWFVAADWASGQWHAHPIGLGVAYLVAFAARTQHAQTWVLGLLITACGLAVEASLTALGAFHYYHPDAMGLPMWLPGLYLHVTPLALAIATALRER